VQPADPPAGTPLLLNEFLVLPYLLTQDSILFVALRLAQHRTLLVELALHLVDLVLLFSCGLGEVRYLPLERRLGFLGFRIIGKDLVRVNEANLEVGRGLGRRPEEGEEAN